MNPAFQRRNFDENTPVSDFFRKNDQVYNDSGSTKYPQKRLAILSVLEVFCVVKKDAEIPRAFLRLCVQSILPKKYHTNEVHFGVIVKEFISSYLQGDEKTAYEAASRNLVKTHAGEVYYPYVKLVDQGIRDQQAVQLNHLEEICGHNEFDFQRRAGSGDILKAWIHQHTAAESPWKSKNPKVRSFFKNDRWVMQIQLLGGGGEAKVTASFSDEDGIPKIKLGYSLTFDDVAGAGGYDEIAETSATRWVVIPPCADPDKDRIRTYFRGGFLFISFPKSERTASFELIPENLIDAGQGIQPVNDNANNVPVNDNANNAPNADIPGQDGNGDLLAARINNLI